VAARAVVETGQPARFERLVPSTGLWLDIQVFRVEGGVGTVFRDITARKLAEQRLAQTEAQFRSYVDSMQIGVVVHEPSSRIRYANPRALELLGLTEDQILGRTAFDPEWAVVHEDGSPFPGEEHPVSIAMRERRPVRNVVMGVERPRDGRVWLLVNAAPRLDDAGEVIEAMASFSDITEERALHARLAEADRITALGTLAAGVAHEINNPLAFVRTNLEYLREQAGARPPATDRTWSAEWTRALDDALEGAERVQAIVSDLKALSRADEEACGPVDVNALLESAIRMTWNHLRHRARLDRRLTPVPPVVANEARLSQVFINLLMNAIQAAPDRSADHTITVATHFDRESHAVAISVRDTGVGMTTDVRKRIFDPFFTTKPVGEGTGLGLPICHTLVSAMGGHIRVDSAPGAGSTFRVVLPVAPASAAPDAANVPTPDAAALKRRGRLLVIDDEPLVAGLVTRVVEQEHDVVFETTAAAALGRLRAGERFDAIVCDLMMPEASGMDFYEALERDLPDLLPRVLFMSGGAFTPEAAAFLARFRGRCLDKPFGAGQLRTALRGVIG
jgi:PAS domain S-box-containing protein